MYTNRFYRSWIDSDLVGFEVKVDETDLFVLAEKNLECETRDAVIKYRADIKDYIKIHPQFEKLLKPIEFDENAPEIIKRMILASQKTNVGSMAAVAGAMAEFVGRDLLKFSEEVIVENGGDIFIKSSKDRKFAIYAGNSPLSGKIAILVKAKKTPLGVCTSSGTVGHSLSLGKADAVCVAARDSSLSDAAATAICNIVKSKETIEKALNMSKSIEGIMGCVVIYGDKIGSVGEVELV